MPRYLEGTSVIHLLITKEGRSSLVGKHVQYIREVDIDKSGRGYFFPRAGMIAGFSQRGAEIAIDDPMNYTIVRSDLREMVLVDSPAPVTE